MKWLFYFTIICVTVQSLDVSTLASSVIATPLNDPALIQHRALLRTHQQPIIARPCIWPQHLRPEETRKYLVIYAYFETEMAKINLDFFLRVGVAPLLHHEHIDLVFILSSPLTLRLPVARNVFNVTRNNYGMDMCAYKQTLDGLSNITGHTAEAYSYIVLINASVRGPFLPVGVERVTNWLAHFAGQLTDGVRLAGLSVSCMWLHQADHPFLQHLPLQEGNRYPLAHMQSMFLMVDAVALQLIRQQMPCSHIHWHVIVNGEIGLSRAILSAGWGWAPQAAFTQGIDWRNVTQLNQICDENSNAMEHQHVCDVGWLHGHPWTMACHSHDRDTGGDSWYPNTYLGINPHPIETIFFKTNRNVTSPVIERLTDWYYRRTLV